MHSGINYGEKQQEDITETNVRFPSERLLSANSSIMYNGGRDELGSEEEHGISTNAETSASDELAKLRVKTTTALIAPKPSLQAATAATPAVTSRPSLKADPNAKIIQFDAKTITRSPAATGVHQPKRAQTAAVWSKSMRNLQLEPSSSNQYSSSAWSAAPSTTSMSTSVSSSSSSSNSASASSAKKRVLFAKYTSGNSFANNLTTANENSAATSGKRLIAFHSLTPLLSFSLF